MSDDMWWPWPPTEYFTQKEEFERDLSDQMRRIIADLDRIFPLLSSFGEDFARGNGWPRHVIGGFGLRFSKKRKR